MGKPLVILAPMDGITDPPFRRFVKQVEPRVVVFSEFLSSTLVAQKHSLAKSLFKIYDDEKPVVIQLYGKDAEHFRIAAQLAEAQGAAGIDINMGCPAKKVVAHRHGSALMREIDLACAIIASVKSAVSVPVTVKTRLGWEDESNLIPFAKRLVDNGLDGITIHGRTYQQKFDGLARYEPIYALKDALSIPVFGNGDIDSSARALNSLGNLDGLMVGRAAVADPWLMRRICDGLAGVSSEDSSPSFHHKMPLWKEFARMLTEERDERHACQSFRKYLVAMVREMGFDAEVRKLSVSVESLAQVNEVLELFAARQVA